MDTPKKPTRQRRKRLIIAVTLLAAVGGVRYFWPGPPDLLRKSTKLIELWGSSNRYTYCGRINGNEVLILRTKDSGPTEALALHTSTRAQRPLTGLTALLQKHSASSARVNPDGHTVIWTHSEQAGLTDINGITDRTIESIPEAKNPVGSYLSGLWSAGGAKWLIVRYESGIDSSWPTMLILGSRDQVKPEKLRTDSKMWTVFGHVWGVTDDDLVIGNGSNKVTAVDMRNNSVMPMKPTNSPKDLYEMAMTPGVHDKEIWMQCSISVMRDNPILKYFAQWTDRWNTETTTVFMRTRGHTDDKLIGMIGPTELRARMGGAGTVDVFYLSPDGRSLDFEWDGWLYTASVNY